GYLQEAAHHQARVVLVLHAVVELGVLADDLTLVARLLDPLHGAVAGARHRVRVRARAGPRRDQDGVAAPPGRVQSATVVEGADVDVGRRGSRLPGRHRVA